MSVFEHSRWKIFNKSQHPLKHDLADFLYVNPRLPGVNNAQMFADYVTAAMYPNYIGSFATKAALPALAGPNDYAIVNDDGDGKSAGYVWIKHDNVSGWFKRYDVDWSIEGIMAEALNRVEPMYVARDGFDQKDAAGVPIAGLFAGQQIYGGASAGTNLTLSANSGDAAGHSGFVQVDDILRPTVHNTYDLGTALVRWANVYCLTATSGTLVSSSGSIVDSSGLISFAGNNLVTTGTITAAHFVATTDVKVGGTMTLSTGSITDSSGAISFGAANLSNTGTITATGIITGASGSKFGTLTLSNGSIVDSSGSISFGPDNLATTGTLSAGNTTVPQIDAGNLRTAGNSITAQNIGGSINLNPNGVGTVNVTGTLSVSSDATVGGNTTITGFMKAGNIKIQANVISSQNANGNVTLAPNGSGLVEMTTGMYPTTNNAQDSGKSGNAWNKIWVSGSIGGATQITISDLMTVRNVPYRDAARTQPAQAGDALFWDAVSGTWLANHPDTEIKHEETAGLWSGAAIPSTNPDAGHPQFVLLAGRTGGQVVQGGTAASDNLTLESTSNGTKGSVYTKDAFKPFTDASFAAGWSGTDLGSASNNFRDLYTKGQLRGARMENFTSATLPASSGSAVGRLVYATDNKKLYVDTGAGFVVAGVGKWLSDTAWNGVMTTLTVDVSANIQDARNAIWQLCDNTNSYERVYCQIRAISATQVQINVTPALPAGSYRLIGLE